MVQRLLLRLPCPSDFHDSQVDTIPAHDGVAQLSQVILAELEGRVGNESQQDKKQRAAVLAVENGEDQRGGKGNKGKQKNSKGEEHPEAKSWDTPRSDGKPTWRTQCRLKNPKRPIWNLCVGECLLNSKDLCRLPFSYVPCYYSFTNCAHMQVFENNMILIRRFVEIFTQYKTVAWHGMCVACFVFFGMGCLHVVALYGLSFSLLRCF